MQRGVAAAPPASGRRAPDGPYPLAPRIEASGFSFHPTGGDRPPLAGLELRLPPRGFLLVAGPTGAGKSILLNLLAGLAGLYPAPHAQGRLDVRFPDDAPLEGTASSPSVPTPRPGRIALVMQAPRDGLVGLAVLDALALPLEEQGIPPQETKRRIEDALHALDLLPLAERDVATLSGGEARRVALAGALAQDVGLLLLDEPFADLDPAATNLLRADLTRLAGTRTIVVAEHRTHLVRDLADHTLHLVPARAAAPPDSARLLLAAPERALPPPRIRAQGLTIRRGDRRLIAGADLDWGPGVLALGGPNGAGKTSLLLTLAGLLRPDAGTVDVGGSPVWSRGRRAPGSNARERRLRRRLQVAFQDPFDAFFTATVRQELAQPLIALEQGTRRAVLHAVDTALRDADVRHLADMAPARLSGGEARTVQTLGALLVAPRILFLDEPTTGLDAAHRARLSGLLARAAAQGMLVVVATHESDIVPASADWAFLAGDGSLLVGAAARPGAPVPASFGYTARASGERTP